MSNWIFIVTKQQVAGAWITAREIFETRIGDAFWGLGERTPNRKSLKAGDRVVFYVGIPGTCFAGSATLSTASYKLGEQEKLKLSHGKQLYIADFGVKLTDIHIWEQSIPAQNMIDSLSFIENRQYWGTYFQGGIRGISDDDFQVLTAGELSSKVVVKGGDHDIENAYQFALESYLEEFIEENWNKIQWGRSLQLYESSDSNGRQFPANKWSIDFLAVDQETNDLVVVELKRGQTSDSTVGQVLRYMGWVKENVAEDGQEVVGIIVCHEMDDALKYAIQSQPDITILRYVVNFKLESALPTNKH
ncbi:MAG: DUF1016 family protein [Proteobacteria bacterium]|nr:DUF1016 family protein [Pseudomonadota bacterium]MBU1451795.1 DUF1016 family protein [Pseudomonadota bacterium]MBU2468544.1 DUF1016 family protein [Pseudomonadota bacterium]MBU2519140.1 DUF1016 family protein [Pseudomonadota bacterium]